MKLGVENKRNVIALSILGVIAAIVLYFNVFSSGSSSPEVRPVAVAPPKSEPPAVTAPAPEQLPVRRASTGRQGLGEFKPVLASKRGDKPVDLSGIDPTLRLDLLATVQAVQPEGGARNLFQFGQTPASADDLPHIPPILPKGGKGVITKNDPPPPPPGPPVPPPPPAIALKYYGYSTARMDGRKRAFFLDGEDIVIASEGELVKRRYKLIRIGVNSVTMEDTQFKNTQTLPLQEDAIG